MKVKEQGYRLISYRNGNDGAAGRAYSLVKRLSARNVFSSQACFVTQLFWVCFSNGMRSIQCCEAAAVKAIPSRELTLSEVTLLARSCIPARFLCRGQLQGSP